MKKLFLFFALIAYAFSDYCDLCDDNCKFKYPGLFEAGDRRRCVIDCKLEYC